MIQKMLIRPFIIQIIGDQYRFFARDIKKYPTENDAKHIIKGMKNWAENLKKYRKELEITEVMDVRIGKD